MKILLFLQQEALKFYNDTKPGALAFAFGTSHGLYKSKANLDYKLVKDIANIIPVPLVMHGTSGISFDAIKQAIDSGITKVNVGTDLLIVYNKAIRKYLENNPLAYDIRKINSPGINAIKEITKKYLELFNQGR